MDLQGDEVMMKSMSRLSAREIRSLDVAPPDRKHAILDAVLDCVAMTGMLVVIVLATLIMGL